MLWWKKRKGCIYSALVLLMLVSACGSQDAESSDAVRPIDETNTTPTLTTVTTVTAEAIAPVRFGVLSIDSATSVNERYSPLLEYLTETVGRPFKLVPVSQEGQFTEVADGKLDFTTNNPLAAVQIRRLHNTQFLVTHSRPKTGAEFSGLIVVRQDSDIQTLDDLQGKRVACVAFQTAAAGCTFQIFHLLQNDIDPFTDFSSFAENKSQDNIVFAVLNNTIDAGFIRTGQLEKMLTKGLINDLNDLRILDPKADDFPFVHTTDLYPEWPIAALDATDPELVASVESALLNIPDQHPALAALNAEGFIPAVDYTKLDTLIQSLQLRSWDTPSGESSTE